MDIKQNLKELYKNQKKNINYWLAFIFIVNMALIAQHSFLYATDGQCRNYMYFHSQLHSCSLFEFMKYGWTWLSFTNVFIFAPLAAFMVMVSNIMDVVFSKEK